MNFQPSDPFEMEALRLLTLSYASELSAPLIRVGSEKSPGNDSGILDDVPSDPPAIPFRKMRPSLLKIIPDRIGDNELTCSAEQKEKEETRSREIKAAQMELKQSKISLLNDYLDQIQSSQRGIRKALQSYEENLASVSADLRAIIKATFDEKLQALIPPNHNIKITSAEVKKWMAARQSVYDLVWAVELEIVQLKNPRKGGKPARQQKQKPENIQKDIFMNPSGRETKEQPNPIVVCSPAATSLYSQVDIFSLELKRSLKPLTGDPTQKRFIGDCKKAVTLILGRITAKTLKHNFANLSGLLSGTVVKVNNNLTIHSGAHALGTKFVTMILSQKFLERDYESALVSEYALLIVRLGHRFANFALHFRYQLYKRFPAMVPSFQPQFDGQSDQEYKEVQGYIDGESLQHYLDRVRAITRLYASILITRPPKGESNPFSLDMAWKWLADVLNLDPVATMSVMTVTEFLEVTAEQLHRVYGRQFKRMVEVLKGPYLERLKDIGGEDASFISRYKLLMEKVHKW